MAVDVHMMVNLEMNGLRYMRANIDLTLAIDG